MSLKFRVLRHHDKKEKGWSAKQGRRLITLYYLGGRINR
ncbi:hypothetical protein VRK_36630 [Vibrio sp. MEBiC08052]|nr:hypothetical protein VRK_36630 [Vibrio sp. MEBiC08052]